MNKKLIPLAILGLYSFNCQAIAEEDTSKISLSPVVVTATRIEQNSFDLPMSIDVVDAESIHDGQAEMNLSESLIRVPGLTAQNRSQMAQDPQIATRGFGARSAFGVRGVRILVDGISLSMPDGIAQPGNIDLETVKSIEILKGPFSALYGSSSGGTIQLITADAPKTPEVGFSFMAGSYGTTKESAHATGTTGGIEYLLNIDHFDTDGYRQHSSAWKDQATAQFKFDLSEKTTVRVLANYFKSEAQDPLGLAGFNGFDGYSGYTFGKCTSPNCTTNKTYSAFTNPSAAPDAAILANTRVARNNTQAGVNIEHRFDENNTFNLVASLGQRDNQQFLALPVQKNTSGSTAGTTYYPYLIPGSYGDLSRGRDSVINRDFWNTELTWTNHGDVFTRPYQITSGLAYGSMDDARKDINASGGIDLPVTMNAVKRKNSANVSYTINNINRNENDHTYNFDQFVQGKLSILDNTDIHAGVRHSYVSMDFKGNSDAVSIINGSTSFEKTTPVIGVIFKATPAVNLYANYGKGFETPTMIEMAYNSPTSATGPNLALKPSTSDNYEVGVKAFVLDNTRVGAAVFKVDTTNEIIVSQNATYTVYGNAAQTSRKGIELSADSQLPHNIGLYGAYTYLDAKFDNQYTSGIGGTVYAGNLIPGTYKQQVYGEISWKYPELNFKTALEGRSNSKVFINDVNQGSAPGYAVFNIRAGFDQQLSNWKFSEYLRVENIFDRDYIGAVRINDNNNRNYEPAPGRNWLLGLSASYRF